MNYLFHRGPERYGLSVTVEPVEEPITLAEAKTHCRVDHSADDDYLAALIRAAREVCEKEIGRAFVTQSLRMTMECFPPGVIELPRPPLISVTSIQYYDISHVLQTLPATQYEVDTDSDPGRVAPGFFFYWPVTYSMLGAVAINYTAGYGGRADVPQSIKQAMLLDIGHWYENRSAVEPGAMQPVPMAASMLLGSQWSGNYG